MANDSSDKRYPKLVTNEDLRRLIESRENSSGFVSMLHPLEMAMSRELLEQLVRDSLGQLREHTSASPKEQLGVDRSIQQRVDFLAWLQGQPEQVYMAIYPADMDGLDDLEDLDELIGPDDPTPPALPF